MSLQSDFSREKNVLNKISKCANYISTRVFLVANNFSLSIKYIVEFHSLFVCVCVCMYVCVYVYSKFWLQKI